MPTTRGRNHDEQASGTRPRRANTKPNVAAVEASRTSIGSVIVAPTPTDGPLIAAMTGLVSRKIRSVTRPPSSRWRPSGSRSMPASGGAPSVSKVVSPPPRSAPAQKPRPAPVTTTARTDGSPSISSQTAHSSTCMCLVKALRRVRAVERDGRDAVVDVVGDLPQVHVRRSGR